MFSSQCVPSTAKGSLSFEINVFYFRDNLIHGVPSFFIIKKKKIGRSQCEALQFQAVTDYEIKWNTQGFLKTLRSQHWLYKIMEARSERDDSLMCRVITHKVHGRFPL